MTLANSIIELTVVAAQGHGSASGSETFFVEALVPPDLRGERAHNGKIWIEHSDGRQTNTLPFRFEPALEHWYAVFEDDLKAYGAGGKKDAIACAGISTSDPDHVVGVVLLHRYDGWSELRAPFAGGSNFAQGYHIGNAWSEYSKIRLFYTVATPRGIPPVAIAGLYWGGPSNVPYLAMW